jgi:hypothetical protein
MAEKVESKASMPRAAAEPAGLPDGASLPDAPADGLAAGASLADGLGVGAVVGDGVAADELHAATTIEITARAVKGTGVLTEDVLLLRKPGARGSAGGQRTVLAGAAPGDAGLNALVAPPVCTRSAGRPRSSRLRHADGPFLSAANPIVRESTIREVAAVPTPSVRGRPERGEIDSLCATGAGSAVDRSR